MMQILIRLATMIADALSGKRSDEEIAKALVDAAFDTGVAPALLMDHLSARGIHDAELAADIAEFAKLTIAQMKKDGGLP